MHIIHTHYVNVINIWSQYLGPSPTCWWWQQVLAPGIPTEFLLVLDTFVPGWGWTVDEQVKECPLPPLSPGECSVMEPWTRYLGSVKKKAG